MINGITGCILAGGKSSRYGADKSLLKIGAETIIERLIRQISGLFPETVVVTNNDRDYGFLGIPVYTDIYKNIGPLGGIHSALVHSVNEKVFILSCDIPFMTADFIKYVIAFNSVRPVILPSTNGIIQPLCGIYSKSCIPFIQTMIGVDNKETGSGEPKQWRYSPLVVIEEMKAELIDVVRLYPAYDEKLFCNINHPEDYERVLKTNSAE